MVEKMIGTNYVHGICLSGNNSNADAYWIATSCTHPVYSSDEPPYVQYSMRFMQDGNFGVRYMQQSTNWPSTSDRNYAVMPVITLNAGLDCVGGEGTVVNPWIIK